MSQKLIEQVKGQERAIQFLMQALASRRLPQSMLFCGPSGVGKSKVALALAQCLACEAPQDGLACGQCSACLRIEKKQSEALIEIEPAGTQHKIEQIRTLLHDLSLSMGARRRTVIIKDAHLMTTQSANALLKTLEEPPENTFFVLIAPSVTSVLPTIRSRTQILQFRTLDREAMTQICAVENIQVADWQVESSHGQMDHLLTLQNEDVSAIRDAAVNFWNDFKTAPVFSKLTNRESAIWVTRFWQELMRDAFFQKLGLEPLIHQDRPEAVAQLAQLTNAQLSELALATTQLERDIQANADYNLAFENYLRNDTHAPLD